MGIALCCNRDLNEEYSHIDSHLRPYAFTKAPVDAHYQKTISIENMSRNRSATLQQFPKSRLGRSTGRLDSVRNQSNSQQQ